MYSLKSDSRSIIEKNKYKTKQQKLHGIGDTYKKITFKKKINKKLQNYGKGLECLQTLKTSELN